MIDWDKLRIFHAVAEAGSFTHAGDTLNLSQSAVSRQISALEDSLKTPLFHRHARGLILTEQNKPADAIREFTSLTEDYPELPEPYNNLAVLYASQGQYDKARKSLEMAIRTHPSYAIAHENLGDVYAKMGKDSLAEAQWQKSVTEWHRALPAEFEAAKMAEVEQKISALKRRLAQQKTPTDAKP
jgi:tetratricopeptide (TPR) repeat protein